MPRAIRRSASLAARLVAAGALTLLAACGAARAQQAAPVTPAAAAAAPSPTRWEDDIRAFESADRQAPPPAHAVLFVGSSSIRFWETLAIDFPEVPTINRGFGGSQLGDVLYYVDRIVLPYAPRLVVLYAGDNDLAEGREPAQVADDFAAFVRRVHERLPDTRIVFLSIKPSPARWAIVDQMRLTNARVREIAAREPNVQYVDGFTPLLDAEGRARPELYREDGLHLNARGYAIWRATLAPFVR